MLLITLFLSICNTKLELLSVSTTYPLLQQSKGWQIRMEHVTSNEFDLAPSEKRPTYEFLSDSGTFSYRVIILMSQVATFVPGQRSKVT